MLHDFSIALSSYDDRQGERRPLAGEDKKDQSGDVFLINRITSFRYLFFETF